MTEPTLDDLLKAKLQLAQLQSEKDSDVPIIIYPLTEDSKLITTVEPFEVPANCTTYQIQQLLKQKGVLSRNWYGAVKGEELPEKYKQNKKSSKTPILKPLKTY